MSLPWTINPTMKHAHPDWRARPGCCKTAAIKSPSLSTRSGFSDVQALAFTGPATGRKPIYAIFVFFFPLDVV